MNEMEKKQKLVDYINDMSNDEMVELYNRYCEASHCRDAIIYNACELDEVLEGRAPIDILSMGFSGDFNPQRSYFWFNGYGNLESADFDDTPVYPPEIVDYMLRTEDGLGNDEIQYMLDEEDEDNE